jgi:hypothetical protein
MTNRNAVGTELTGACRALPILRQLGAQSGGSMIRGGDFSMLKVWAGLEARSFLQASIESVRLQYPHPTTSATGAHTHSGTGRKLCQVRSPITKLLMKSPRRGIG